MRATLSPSEAAFLISEAENRAEALERANHEMDILYEASNKLVRAATPSELLEAVSNYARNNGAHRGLLAYIDYEGEQRVDEVVAEWMVGDYKQMGLGTQIRLAPEDRFSIQVARPVFFENLLEDERTGAKAKEIDRTYNVSACVLLPLYNKGRRVASISFGWDHPRSFDERDDRIYTVLLQQVTAVVDAIRLFDHLQKRASELELANHELNLLYKTGELINSANTYQEVVEAVAQFDLEADVVTLMIWDTWDWKTAEFLDVHVVIDRHNRGGLTAGSRLPKEAFPIAKVMMGQRVWLFEDAESDPRIDPITAENWAALGIRSFMGPALYIRKCWLGGITFHSSRPRQFTQREERLLAGVGDLVQAAIIRIRLQDEKERARYQAEKLGKVNALLSQSTHEQDILNAVAELFRSLGVAWFGLAYSQNSLNRDSMSAEYVATFPPTKEAYPEGVFDLNNYPCLKVAHDFPYEPVYVENIETDHRPEFTFLLTKPETAMWKAVVIMPLQTGDQWQGLLSFYWYEPQIFTPEVQNIFSVIMPNVASVVTVRKAYLAEQEARKENEVLYKASKGINRAASVAEIITALEQLNVPWLDISLAIWENYDHNKASYLEFIVNCETSRWKTGDRLPRQSIPLAYSTTQQLIVIVDDTSDRNQIDEQSANTVEVQGYHAMMLVHLLVVNHCIGILMFSSTTVHVFTPYEKRLAAGIGELVSAAIERFRLHDESETARREAERHALQAQKLASLEERTRLARELHDSVSQVLYGIGLGARTARTIAKQDPTMLQEPLDYILSLAEAGLTEMRALIFELRPESLEHEGLITTLKKQALSLSARYGISVETEFCSEPTLPLDDKESLYRIAREALHNIVKHAQASSIRLTFIKFESGYRLEVKDNGLGFDSGQTFTDHLGLKSMRERTIALGGIFDITSRVGDGTTIAVTISTNSD